MAKMTFFLRLSARKRFLLVYVFLVFFMCYVIKSWDHQSPCPEIRQAACDGRYNLSHTRHQTTLRRPTLSPRTLYRTTLYRMPSEVQGSILPNESDSRNVRNMLPNESDSRNVRNILPNESDSRNVRNILPNESESRNVRNILPNESESRNARNILPNESDSRNVRNIVPNESDSRNVRNILPNESESRNARNILPNESESRNARNILPDESDSRNARNILPDESDSRNAQAIAAQCKEFGSEEYLAGNASFFVPTDTVVNSFVPDWLVQPSPCPAAGPFLLVVIPSLDSHTDRRTAIRNTWASPAYGHPWPARTALPNDTVKVVFFLGVSNTTGDQDVVREAGVYHDIVRANFSDTYHNLSLKMAAVLIWSATFCRGARHVIKVDEDTFVHLPVLLRVLEILSAKISKGYVLGRKHGRAKPPVVRSGRWQVSKDVYPLPFFPNYVYGHSYVMSGDAIKALHYAYQHTPHVIPNEDAYVTGVLAKTANISRYRSDHFAIQYKPASDCPLADGKVISHTFYTNNTLIYKMWDLIRSGNCSHS